MSHDTEKTRSERMVSKTDEVSEEKAGQGLGALLAKKQKTQKQMLDGANRTITVLDVEIKSHQGRIKTLEDGLKELQVLALAQINKMLADEPSATDREAMLAFMLVEICGRIAKLVDDPPGAVPGDQG